MNGAKIAGATFSLLMTLGALTGTVFMAVHRVPIGITSCVCGAIIGGFMVRSDWAGVWKPLMGIK